MGKRRKQQTRSGLNPLSYLGIEQQTPILLLTYDRAPTSDDRNFEVGTIWLDRTFKPEHVWMLVAQDPYSATWVRFATGGFTELEYHANTGIAEPVDSNLNVFGAHVIQTEASGNTIEVGFTDSLDGQLIIGGAADGPNWGNLTSTGGTITITEGPNSINLELSGLAALLTLTADDGGVATQSGGNIDFLGGTNIGTTGSGNILTINLDDSIDIAGSLTLSAQGAGVMQTDATGLVFSDNGTDGQVLIGGGTEPTWANITSTDGTVTITNGLNAINLEVEGGGGGTARHSFYAQVINYSTNIPINDPDGFYLGSAQYREMQEIFDVSNAFYPGPSPYAYYTAPETGKYFLNLTLGYYYEIHTPTPTSHRPPCDPRLTMSIETPNRNYTKSRNYPVFSDVLQYNSVSVCVDLSAGDEVRYFFNIYSDAYIDCYLRRSSWVMGYMISRG